MKKFIFLIVLVGCNSYKSKVPPTPTLTPTIHLVCYSRGCHDQRSCGFPHLEQAIDCPVNAKTILPSCNSAPWEERHCWREILK